MRDGWWGWLLHHVNIHSTVHLKMVETVKIYVYFTTIKHFKTNQIKTFFKISFTKDWQGFERKV